MGRVAIECAAIILAGKAALIALAFLLGAMGLGFPNGLGTVLPAFLGMMLSAQRLARREGQPLSALEAWTAAGVVTGVVTTIEALFTTIVLSLTGNLKALGGDPEFTRVLLISGAMVLVVTFLLTRLLFPLFHQQELHKLAKDKDVFR